MASDDIRAVVMLLAQDMCDIRLIVTSDGVLSPDEAIMPFFVLMSRLGIEGIPLFAGRRLGKDAPAWRDWNRKFLSNSSASEKPNEGISHDAHEKIVSVLGNGRDSFSVSVPGPPDQSGRCHKT